MIWPLSWENKLQVFFSNNNFLFLCYINVKCAMRTHENPEPGGLSLLLNRFFSSLFCFPLSFLRGIGGCRAVYYSTSHSFWWATVTNLFPHARTCIPLPFLIHLGLTKVSVIPTGTRQATLR